MDNSRNGNVKSNQNRAAAKSTYASGKKPEWNENLLRFSWETVLSMPFSCYFFNIPLSKSNFSHLISSEAHVWACVCACVCVIRSRNDRLVSRSLFYSHNHIINYHQHLIHFLMGLRSIFMNTAYKVFFRQIFFLRFWLGWMHFFLDFLPSLLLLMLLVWLVVEIVTKLWNIASYTLHTLPVCLTTIAEHKGELLSDEYEKL